jgi:hypothetical protein
MVMRGQGRVIVAVLVAAAPLLARCAASDGAGDESVPLPPRVVGSSGGLEGGSLGDGGAACDPSRPFAPPTLVPGLESPLQYRGTPKLSLDERSIYFTVLVPADGGTRAQLAGAHRESREAPFGPVGTVDRLNSSFEDYDPSVTSDELVVAFVSTRSGNPDLWYGTRRTTADGFADPRPIPGVNTPATELHPFYRADGGELWFVSDRADAGLRIYSAKLDADGGAFGPAKMIDELVPGANVAQPALTEDGLRIVFASQLDEDSDWDLWTAQRDTTSAPFSPPTPLEEENTPGDEFAGWLSPDGCRVYFSSDRDTDAAAPVQRIWVASRPSRAAK